MSLLSSFQSIGEGLFEGTWHGAPTAALPPESLTALLPRGTLLVNDAESMNSSTPSKPQGSSRPGRGWYSWLEGAEQHLEPQVN